MTLTARLGAYFKIIRRGAHDSLTFMTGMVLFLTIVHAFLEAGRVDDTTTYVLYVAVWLLIVYSTMFRLLGHVTELEEKLSEPDESLQSIRDRAATLPIIGFVGVLFSTRFL